jgi:hypothetical protein
MPIRPGTAVSTRTRSSKSTVTTGDKGNGNNLAFVHLPGELRNLIYHIYFNDIRVSHFGGPGYHVCSHANHSKCTKVPRYNAQIFYVSHQIYAEASSIYYETHFPRYEFRHHNHSVAISFWRRIKEAHPNFKASMRFNYPDNKKVYPFIESMVASLGLPDSAGLQAKFSNPSSIPWSQWVKFNDRNAGNLSIRWINRKDGFDVKIQISGQLGKYDLWRQLMNL